MPMGYSFQPGADQVMGGEQGQAGRSVAAPDSSVKVLSFRMPKNDVRGQVAPASLLNAPGGAAAGMGGLSPQLLSLLLSAFSAPRQGTPGAFGGGSPAQPSMDSTPSQRPGFQAPQPKFTIGDSGGRMPGYGPDYGPALASGGVTADRSGGEIPMGGGTGYRTPEAQPDRSGIGQGERFNMDKLGFLNRPDYF